MRRLAQYSVKDRHAYPPFLVAELSVFPLGFERFRKEVAGEAQCETAVSHGKAVWGHADERLRVDCRSAVLDSCTEAKAFA